MHLLRFSFSNHGPKFFVPVLFGAILGCGEESPPYDGLPLRDALRAAPEVVASLSEDSRHDLALRLRDAENVEAETLTFAPESLNLGPLVTSADSTREAADKDAVMFGQILATDGHGLLEIHALTDEDRANDSPIEVLGEAADGVAPFEEAALNGAAGKTIRGFVARTHAKSVLRMTGLPIAAVAWSDKVYVNESWLVAMSSLEDACTIPPQIVPGQTGSSPGLQPLSVDFSPFDLPADLSECTTQVTKTCSCATNQSCTHVPTDSTFTDANAECTWVNQQSSNAAALCILALLSLDNVRECVKTASPACTFLPVNNRTDAFSFATDQRCTAVINACLHDGNTQSVGSNSSSSCKYCDGKNNDCLECAQDSGTCIQTCELCIQICAYCAENSNNQTSIKEKPFQYAAIRPVTQCSVRTQTGQSPLPGPMGTVFWLVAPVAYLLSRSRRRM